MLAKKRYISKALIVLLVLSFYKKQTFSQIVYSNKETANVSFVVGLTNSNLYNDTIAYKSGNLLNAGFGYAFRLSDKTKIAAEFLLSAKAFRKDNPIVKYRFGFLDVPIYLQFHLSDDFKLNLGVQYSKYLFSQYAFIDGSKKTGVHVKTLTSGIDNDIALLGGLEFNFLKNFNFGLRYTLSTNSFVKGKSYFGVFQASLRYYVWSTNRKFFAKAQSGT